jgi:hypothetical protein
MPTADRTPYQLYGRLCSSAIELPELALSAPTRSPDFTVSYAELGEQLPTSWTHSVLDPDGFEWFAFEKQGHVSWFRFDNQSLWRCERVGSTGWQIQIDIDSQPPIETLRHFLIDEVVPTLLASTGSFVLHGAAVAMEQGALVLLGESQMGKSTLAISFAQSGHPLLTDDCVVIDRNANRYAVQPSYPSVRVWDSSAVRMLGTGSTGVPFAHYTEKRRYSDGLVFAAAAARLSGIATIDAWGDAGSSDIVLEPVKGHAASAALLSGVKSLPVGHDKAAVVSALVDLAEQIPVARLTLPDGFEHLEAVRARLARWLAEP